MTKPHPEMFVNPDPEMFTNAEAAELVAKGENLDKIALQARMWFAHCAEGNWLALGLDIVTDGMMAVAGTPTKTRSQLREALQEDVEECREMATAQYPFRWKKEELFVADAWLDISPYRLWKMVNEAREWGLMEFDEQFLGMTSGVETGSTIGPVIEERFSDIVRQWREEQTSEEVD